MTFGFSCGEYEEHLVENVKRYTGWERLDKEWVDTGLASREAYELCKYGELLQV